MNVKIINRLKINPTRDFINKLIRREKYLHSFVTESTIDHANLQNRTSAEFGELVSKYESEDNLYKTDI